MAPLGRNDPLRRHQVALMLMGLLEASLSPIAYLTEGWNPSIVRALADTIIRGHPPDFLCVFSDRRREYLLRVLRKDTKEGAGP